MKEQIGEFFEEVVGYESWICGYIVKHEDIDKLAALFSKTLVEAYNQGVQDAKMELYRNGRQSEGMLVNNLKKPLP